MYYEVHGEDGAGRPLVLLHGGLLTIDLSFGAVLPALAAGRRVIAAELQGHGRTADIDRDIDLGFLASDVAGLLDHLSVGQADVLGFGDHDFIRLEHAVQMHELIPGSQLAVLPGTTHMGVLRRADLIVPLVAGFLG